ncbi:hypothetical protein FDUTEX481_00497 [Tolypothrix sp. PCC 7601]|nr:hypothetical protein FDUTEX481_00497 [Tolypothrix sp. PCC 7601]
MTIDSIDINTAGVESKDRTNFLFISSPTLVMKDEFYLFTQLVSDQSILYRFFRNGLRLIVKIESEANRF